MLCFAHMHFANGENFAWAIESGFYFIGNYTISYKVKNAADGAAAPKTQTPICRQTNLT